MDRLPTYMVEQTMSTLAEGQWPLFPRFTWQKCEIRNRQEVQGQGLIRSKMPQKMKWPRRKPPFTARDVMLNECNVFPLHGGLLGRSQIAGRRAAGKRAAP